MIVREEEEVVKVDGKSMERAMGFEPTTFCLGSKHSTTELRPHSAGYCITLEGKHPF
jgi:hypothetical protein